MGYTHYWKPDNKPIPEEAVTVLTSILERGQEEGVIETDGEQALHIFSGEVWFNGAEPFDHETFCYKPGERMGFCKTNRKPYDLYVCVTLIVLKFYIEDMTFTSDGRAENEEWLDAVNFLLKNAEDFGLDKRLTDSLELITEGNNEELFKTFPRFK